MTKLYGMFLMLGTLAISACNTVEGAGRDMTAAGVAIQQEARSAR